MIDNKTQPPALLDALEALRAASSYFAERADAEYFTDSPAPVGNEEMRLLCMMDANIANLERFAQATEQPPALHDLRARYIEVLARLAGNTVFFPYEKDALNAAIAALSTPASEAVAFTGWTKADGKTLWLKHDGEPMLSPGKHESLGTNQAIYPYTAPQPSAATVTVDALLALQRYDLSDDIGWVMAMPKPDGKWIEAADLDALLSAGAVQGGAK